MGKNTWSFAAGLGLWAIACGGVSNNDFDAPPTAGRGGSHGGSGGSGGTTGGSKSAGGATGKGGTTGTGGDSGGSSGSGTGGSGTGGNGTGGMETGGAGGSSAAGGMETGGSSGTESGGTGGTGMETGGTGGSGMETGGTGGSGMETGGTGGSGMETGGSSGVGGGRAGSGGMANCDELAAEYAKLLEEAQACNPDIDRPQCTEEVQTSLLCGCPTWANADHTEAIEAMRQLEKQASGCIVPCPAILCVAPGTGLCTSSGGDGGRCVNSGLEI